MMTRKNDKVTKGQWVHLVVTNQVTDTTIQSNIVDLLIKIQELSTVGFSTKGSAFFHTTEGKPIVSTSYKYDFFVDHMTVSQVYNLYYNQYQQVHNHIMLVV